MIDVRDSVEAELDEVCEVHRVAFGDDEGPIIAALVRELVADATARPVLSLAATSGGAIVGHVLFTAARIPEAVQPVSARILAPLAVLPERQGTGIGGALIRAGLARLAASGVGLVFVLGHAGYYPRHGFRPVGDLGLLTPHPIPDEHADGWMVQALAPGLLGRIRGTVRCAMTLDRAEFW